MNGFEHFAEFYKKADVYRNQSTLSGSIDSEEEVLLKSDINILIIDRHRQSTRTSELGTSSTKSFTVAFSLEDGVELDEGDILFIKYERSTKRHVLGIPLKTLDQYEAEATPQDMAGGQ